MSNSQKHVRIITDSASDLVSNEYPGLVSVPLTVTFGSNNFRDGVDITHHEFYERLIESSELPVTSQPSPAVFKEAIDAIRHEDPSAEVLIITLSSKLSGTYQSACIAASTYGESVYVLDSLNVTVGERALVEYAYQLCEKGLGLQEVVEKTESARERVRLIALLDTLEYLKKGGRVPKSVAIVGGLLSVKPVIAVEEGEVKILGAARGSRKGNNLLVEEIQKAGGVDFSLPFHLGYSGISDNLIRKYIADSAAIWEGKVDELEYATVGSAIGTHAGPGAIAVAFFAKGKTVVL